MTMPKIELSITKPQLLSLGHQLGLALGPLSPLKPKTADDQAKLRERVISPSLIGSDGNLRPEIRPVFETLANPQAYALLAYAGRSFLLETIYYYPNASSAEGNVSLTDAEDGLKLSSPGVKEDVFPFLEQYIGSSLLKRTEFEFNLPLVDAWVFFGVVDASRRKMLNTLLERATPAGIELTAEEIYAEMAASANNMQWFSPYFDSCLSLAQLSANDIQFGLQNLGKKGLLTMRGDTVIPARSVMQIADEFLLVDAYLRLRMGMLEAGQPQHTDMRVVQGRSGAILYWVYDDQGVDLISLSPAQLMLILSSMIDNPAVHLSEAGASAKPSGIPSSPPERL